MTLKSTAIAKTFLLPVTSLLKSEDGPDVETTFHVRCKCLPRKEVLDLWKAVTPPDASEIASTPEGETPRKLLTDDQVLDRIVVGFGPDIVGEDDQPLPFTPANREVIFGTHPITYDTVRSFFDKYMKLGAKLVDIARHAIRSSHSDGAGDAATEEESRRNLERDAKCMRVDLSKLEPLDAPPPGEAPDADGDVLDVWPENWGAMCLFMACHAQFQLVLGMGGGLWRGASSTCLKQEMQWLDVAAEDEAGLVQKYRVIESEALRLLNQRLGKQR